ncbi:hypothetical protein ACOME3_007587 [Neoechinorhynchus agilis]
MSAIPAPITTVKTVPYDDQKPGTSGLRKRVPHFQQEHYMENFLQSFFNTLPSQPRSETNKGKPLRLFVGGDGRYLVKECIAIVVKMAPANGVAEVNVALDGISFTCDIEALTASHNPGGPHGDFGIKFNGSNGGPALETWTNSAYEVSKSLSEYRICADIEFDLHTVGRYVMQVENMGSFIINVVDCVSPYHGYMKQLFDFDAIRKLLTGFRVTGNALHGVMGPYIKQILVEDLGMEDEDAVKCNCLDDFGGGHPDPNTTYARELLDLMANGRHDFGFAFDGDGDRNMIVGRNGFFVNPCDSLAVIAAHLDCIPYFKNKVTGFARSMPTSQAIDAVAVKMNVKCYETAKRSWRLWKCWKYFGNLMDANLICLCGEESFGTGSNHIREKDGMWAVLAWLSIMARTQKSTQELLQEHWTKFGRHFFTRYDFEECESDKASDLFKHLNALVSQSGDPNFNRIYKSGSNEYRLTKIDNFCYVDPVDGSRAENQGVRILFENGARMIFRISGTGSSGATVRMYLETNEPDCKKAAQMSHDDAIRPLVDLAFQISDLPRFLERRDPTVIT